MTPTAGHLTRVARTLVSTLSLCLVFSSGSSAAELNVLAWCDHQDPKTFAPFEKANDVKVNVKSYEGTGTVVSYLQQSSPGDWDVVSIDSVDIIKLARAKLLDPLNESDYPLADLEHKVFMPQSEILDGKRYGIAEKYGYNSISFNSKRVKVEDLKDLRALFKPEFKGRIGIYDYYFTAIQTAALMDGIKPDEITVEVLPKLSDTLIALKNNAKLFGDIPTVQTALATGDVDIVFGGAEFLVAGLGETKPELDWVLPEQGGLRWQSSTGIFATSQQKDLAKKFIQWTLSPEGNALFAQSSCYWGMPSNTKALSLLSDEAKKRLHSDDQSAYLARSYPYRATSPELDAAMVDAWAKVRGK